MGIIYCWTNKNTGKKYVGQTIHPEQRKRNHIHSAFVRNCDFYFHRSLRKHGLEAFSYEVLEEADGILDDLENKYIDQFNTIWPNGYNQSYGKTLSPESLKKSSNTKKAQWAALSDEEKQIKKDFLRKIATGRPQGDRQKEAAAVANRKKWIVTTPEGTEVIVNDLPKFCKDRGINRDSLYNTYMGTVKFHKGFKLTQYDIDMET